MEDLINSIDKYGFPIMSAGGIGYMIFYVWNWVTKEIKPVLNDTNDVLIDLLDCIRKLDQDLIRLYQKVNVVMELRGKSLEIERLKEELNLKDK